MPLLTEAVNSLSNPVPSAPALSATTAITSIPITRTPSRAFKMVLGSAGLLTTGVFQTSAQTVIDCHFRPCLVCVASAWTCNDACHPRLSELAAAVACNGVSLTGTGNSFMFAYCLFAYDCARPKLGQLAGGTFCSPLL